LSEIEPEGLAAGTRTTITHKQVELMLPVHDGAAYSPTLLTRVDAKPPDESKFAGVSGEGRTVNVHGWAETHRMGHRKVRARRRFQR